MKASCGSLARLFDAELLCAFAFSGVGTDGCRDGTAAAERIPVHRAIERRKTGGKIYLEVVQERLAILTSIELCVFCVFVYSPVD